MSNEINPKEYGIQKVEATKIEKAFEPLIVERDQIAEMYTGLITQEPTDESCKEARRLRNRLVKVRTGIAGVHKTHKAFFLAAGRFVDAWKNKESKPITEMEVRLKEMEEYFVNQEKERLSLLNESRKTELSKYVEELIWMDLSEMEDDVWDAYLSTKKREYNERIAAEQKAEADRIAQEKKERDERIAKEKADNEERKRIEAENRKLQAEAEALKAKEAAERKAHEAEMKKEREKAAKLKAEIEAKEADERKAIEDAAKAKEAELSKGDAAKVKDLISDLEELQIKYQFKSAKNNKMYAEVQQLLGRIITHINQG